MAVLTNALYRNENKVPSASRDSRRLNSRMDLHEGEAQSQQRLLLLLLCAFTCMYNMYCAGSSSFHSCLPRCTMYLLFRLVLLQQRKGQESLILTPPLFVANPSPFSNPEFIDWGIILLPTLPLPPRYLTESLMMFSYQPSPSNRPNSFPASSTSLRAFMRI